MRERKSQYGFMWYLEKKFPLNSYCIIHFHSFIFCPCIFFSSTFSFTTPYGECSFLQSDFFFLLLILVMYCCPFHLTSLWLCFPYFVPLKTSLMSSHCIYTEHTIVITFRWASQTKFILCELSVKRMVSECI